MPPNIKARRGVAPRQASDAILSGKLNRAEDKPDDTTTQLPATINVERAGFLKLYTAAG